MEGQITYGDKYRGWKYLVERHASAILRRLDLRGAEAVVLVRPGPYIVVETPRGVERRHAEALPPPARRALKNWDKAVGRPAREIGAEVDSAEMHIDLAPRRYYLVVRLRRGDYTWEESVSGWL